jgi:hypothetical protein
VAINKKEKIGNEFFAIFSIFNAAIDGYPHLFNYNFANNLHTAQLFVLE